MAPREAEKGRSVGGWGGHHSRLLEALDKRV